MLSLIPISDANPTKRFPIITVLLIVLNLVSFFIEPDLGRDTLQSAEYFFEHAPAPCQLNDTCPDAVQFGEGGPIVPIPERSFADLLVAVVVSLFLHAGLAHIGGNMLFLWVFGNNVEDHLGRVKYLLFYLLGGIAASFAHILTHLDSPLPAVGASGAVAAVMGAYLVLFPRAKVNVLVLIIVLFTVIPVSAFIVLILWFLSQFLIASGPSGVAWMAHVGGFVFGMIAIFLLGGRPQRPPIPTYWNYDSR